MSTIATIAVGILFGIVLAKRTAACCSTPEGQKFKVSNFFSGGCKCKSSPGSPCRCGDCSC